MTRIAMVISLLCLTSCAREEPKGKIKIMPLGDSITQGDRQHDSYRRALWKLLRDGGYDVDFVGSLRSNYGGSPPHEDFDMDHEGHWGWTADEILSRVERWAQAYQPDMVLIHLGSNDLARGEPNEDTVGELRQMIEIFRKHNPDVIILVAQIIGFTYGIPEVKVLNEKIKELAQMNRPDAPVRVVDQFSGFNPNQDTHDGLHPNERGEQKMAQCWYEAIESMANVPFSEDR